MDTKNKPKDGPRSRKAVVKPGTANAGTGTLKPKAPRKTGGGELLATRKEMAGKLGWSVRTLDRLTAAKILPVIVVGRLRMYRPDACMAALERNSTVREVAAP
jgi:hypothetical protein